MSPTFGTGSGNLGDALDFFQLALGAALSSPSNLATCLEVREHAEPPSDKRRPRDMFAMLADVVAVNVALRRAIAIALHDIAGPDASAETIDLAAAHLLTCACSAAVEAVQREFGGSRLDGVKRVRLKLLGMRLAAMRDGGIQPLEAFKLLGVSTATGYRAWNRIPAIAGDAAASGCPLLILTRGY